MVDYKLFGLNNRDRRVYEALLVTQNASIRAIAETTGINRGSVFESIKSLSSVGLVAHVDIGKRKRYSAQDPEKMHELINERRRALKEMHQSVDVYIKSLALEREDPSVFHFASFYDGDEGLANMLRDVLTTARRDKFGVYRTLSSPRVSAHLYNNFQHFTRERIKLGLFVKVIGYGPSNQEKGSFERRILPKEQTDSGAYTIIYGNKVAIATIDTYKHTTGIIIDNPGIASIQRMLFDQMWDSIGSIT